jgi:hypothetical protein
MVGVKGAVPLLDSSFYNNDESRPYVVGPSIEVRLPKGFAIEAAALYQRIGQSGYFPFNEFIVIGTGPDTQNVSGVYFTRSRGNEWDFPVLGKRYFKGVSGWQPYVGLGVALRTVGLHTDTSETTIDSGGLHQLGFHGDTRPGVGVGGVAAVGVRRRVGRLTLMPEFRYTRWDTHDSVLSHNAANAFLGVSF